MDAKIIESIAEWIGLPVGRIRPEMVLRREFNLDDGDLFHLAEWLNKDNVRVPHGCEFDVGNWKTVSDVITACK